jgi:hypothetical protein
VVAFSFDEYQARVAAYLEPAHVELYADRGVWDTMQDAVIAHLEVLR